MYRYFIKEAKHFTFKKIKFADIKTLYFLRVNITIKEPIIIFVILYKNKKSKSDTKLSYSFNLSEKNFKTFIQLAKKIQQKETKLEQNMKYKLQI